MALSKKVSNFMIQFTLYFFFYDEYTRIDNLRNIKISKLYLLRVTNRNSSQWIIAEKKDYYKNITESIPKKKYEKG
jgi:hypothetical protein